MSILGELARLVRLHRMILRFSIESLEKFSSLKIWEKKQQKLQQPLFTHCFQQMMEICMCVVIAKMASQEQVTPGKILFNLRLFKKFPLPNHRCQSTKSFTAIATKIRLKSFIPNSTSFQIPGLSSLILNHQLFMTKK